MSQWKINILTSVIAFVICILIFIIWINSGSFKPLWEIDNKELQKIDTNRVYYSSTYTVKEEFTEADFGIVCGKVEVLLGQSINPNDYIIKDRVTVDGVDRYYLQAQSKRYELIAVGSNSIYNVHKIRTTNIGVSGLRGQTISQTFDTVNDLFNGELDRKRKVVLITGDRQLSMQFNSGILCEMSMEYIEKG